jgi:CRISPR/Cas system CSM-associated protein Csm3 (group 7 of RAMP superfamily)
MPFSFEVLSKGTEILVRFALSPYSSELEIGALLAALETYQRADSTLGGQAARNFGLASVSWLKEISVEDARCQVLYERYLEENKDRLRTELQQGTLGTDMVVCK